ncbi:hypothetical protein FB567DRAFT_526179 [Paraphoma chrysanthemicola]|uniref:Uncharacterized protein n=1 Tax=Paraphoma chrysanthemicola TaxID=798071 RepID=A0A8K0R4E5_9PLEO|nr:hypothetical protein FB567DRAFT_526179 [Paraphoma chrysanthemicola]
MASFNQVSRNNGSENARLNLPNNQRMLGSGQNVQSYVSHIQLKGAASHLSPAVHSISTPKHTYAQHTLRNVPATQPQQNLRRQHQIPLSTNTHAQARTSENAVTDLLPFCTTGPPLQEEQIIALSDVAGSLKEVMMLALGAAAGDRGCVDKLEGAVGRDAAVRIVDFFGGEWEVE